MNITLPDSFYKISKKEQEEYLKKYLSKYYNVTDSIKVLLGIIRGQHRKITEDDLS